MRANLPKAIHGILALLWAVSAEAVTIEPPLADPAEEARAQSLFMRLKCVVCQGESLADSDALLARQMRAQVRERVHTGQSDEAIRDYFATRYGQQILVDTPLSASSAPLWLAPFALLGLGASLLHRYTHRHNRHTTGQPK